MLSSLRNLKGSYSFFSEKYEKSFIFRKGKISDMEIIPLFFIFCTKIEDLKKGIIRIPIIQSFDPCKISTTEYKSKATVYKKLGYYNNYLFKRFYSSDVDFLFVSSLFIIETLPLEYSPSKFGTIEETNTAQLVSFIGVTALNLGVFLNNLVGSKYEITDESYFFGKLCDNVSSDLYVVKSNFQNSVAKNNAYKYLYSLDYEFKLCRFTNGVFTSRYLPQTIPTNKPNGSDPVETKYEILSKILEKSSKTIFNIKTDESFKDLKYE